MNLVHLLFIQQQHLTITPYNNKGLNEKFSYYAWSLWTVEASAL